MGRQNWMPQELGRGSLGARAASPGRMRWLIRMTGKQMHYDIADADKYQANSMMSIKIKYL